MGCSPSSHRMEYPLETPGTAQPTNESRTNQLQRAAVKPTIGSTTVAVHTPAVATTTTKGSEAKGTTSPALAPAPAPAPAPEPALVSKLVERQSTKAAGRKVSFKPTVVFVDEDGEYSKANTEDTIKESNDENSENNKESNNGDDKTKQNQELNVESPPVAPEHEPLQSPLAIPTEFGTQSENNKESKEENDENNKKSNNDDDETNQNQELNVESSPLAPEHVPQHLPVLIPTDFVTQIDNNKESKEENGDNNKESNKDDETNQNQELNVESSPVAPEQVPRRLPVVIPTDFEPQDTSANRKLILDATTELSAYQLPLSASDKAMVMQGWNKVLAFRTAFAEGLLSHWRLLVASDYLSGNGSSNQQREAFELFETNRDPIAIALKERIWDAEDLLMGLLDGAIRSLSPDCQKVQREAYHAIEDDAILFEANLDSAQSEYSFKLECKSVEDYVKLFARCGTEPKHWVIFCQAFVWAIQTHAPYAQLPDDIEELERGQSSAFMRAVAQHVALPAIKAFRQLKSMGEDPIYSIHVPAFWSRRTAQEKWGFGERFYRDLLSNHKQLLDYFTNTDMDALALHLIGTLDLIVASVKQLGDSTGVFRNVLNSLGDRHRRIGIPTFSYALMGSVLIDCLDPFFVEEQKFTAEQGHPIKAEQLRTAFLNLYVEILSLIYYPMLKQERMIAQASEFFEQVRVELNWSQGQLANRLMQVEEEISATGTYQHTSQELEVGARLAWRNSAKCIGRISWNTLQVRDCRHVSDPDQIFHQVETHLKLATAGTNIQSIMTVFQPQSPISVEPFGVRFWSSQYVRYAGYKNESSSSSGEGDFLGDPANAELTEYLLTNNLWTPPNLRTPFDVLPLVLKVPGNPKPFIYQLPKDCVFEVAIEHPWRPEITALGFRWTTVPAISNFKMTLGGVVYQNIPFNGWFVSTEIVRNLMERYGADVKCAKAMGLDVDSDPMWKQNSAFELERAVLHSFQKSGFTIVDPMSVGQSFCVHVRREREKFGRECPGQWSWIGGLVGPTNPTWHLEMRDFLVQPQYQYCADGLTVYNSLTDKTAVSDKAAGEAEEKVSESSRVMVGGATRILILYGSETGNAEAVARRLKRQLQLLKPVLLTLNEAVGLEVVKSRSITHIICICSTFGKGEPPKNSENFFQKPLEPIPNVKFAVLGLGSTLYPDFCNAAVKIDEKFSRAGFARILGVTKADVAAGADGVVQDWLNLVKNIVLPVSLERELLSWAEAITFDPPVNRFKWLEDNTPTSVSGKSIPQSVRWICQSNVELLDTEAAQRSVRKITFELPSEAKYESGDHLVVQPKHSDAIAKRFFKCFETELVAYAKENGFTGGENDGVDAAIEWQTNRLFNLEYVEAGECNPADVSFPTPCTLENAVKSHLDLSLDTRNFVDLLKLLDRFLDGFIETTDESKGDRDKVLKHPLVEQFMGITTAVSNVAADDKTGLIDSLAAEYPTIVSFFERYRELFLQDFAAGVLGRRPHAPLVSLAEVLVIMPKLQPRFYSISSSNIATPTHIDITVGVLKTVTSKGVKIEGVCSHYLAGLRGGIDRAEVSVRTSTFRLPTNTKSPLLMVGTGTGLSPMLGFLNDRAIQREQGHELGEIHLFFGCRTEYEFIYHDTIRSYEQTGLLQLHLALSREPGTPKKYVQHLLNDMGEELCKLLLQSDTHYYVCGDARMADECFEACVQVLRTHGVMSRVAAVHHLKHMRLEGRWQTDVWGIVSHFEDAKKSIEKSKRTAAKIWLSTFGSSDD